MTQLRERPVYRNGLYPHESFRKRHRLQVMDVGGGLAVVLLLVAVMLATAVTLLLGAFWMIRTLWETLVRPA